jgi:polar amino acid transport system substrate-binding protein
MSRAFTIISALIFSLFILLHPNRGAACSKITIAAHPDFPPFVWSDGKMNRGIGPRLADSILRKMGIEITHWPKQPYLRILKRFKEGQIDLVAGLVKNKDREKYTVFVRPEVATIAPYVFVRKSDEFEFSSWENLIGIRGLIVRGTSLGEKFDQYAQANLILVNVKSSEVALKMLMKKRANYVIHHKFRALLDIRRLNLDKQIVQLDKPLGGSAAKIYFGFSKKSSCQSIIARFNDKWRNSVKSIDLEKLIKTEITEYIEFIEQQGKAN